jgi:hypothetical protein
LPLQILSFVSIMPVAQQSGVRMATPQRPPRDVYDKPAVGLEFHDLIAAFRREFSPTEIIARLKRAERSTPPDPQSACRPLRMLLSMVKPVLGASPYIRAENLNLERQLLDS